MTYTLREVVGTWAVYEAHNEASLLPARHFPPLLIASTRNKTRWILDPSTFGGYDVDATTLPKYMKTHIRETYEGAPA